MTDQVALGPDSEMMRQNGYWKRGVKTVIFMNFTKSGFVKTVVLTHPQTLNLAVLSEMSVI